MQRSGDRRWVRMMIVIVLFVVLPGCSLIQPSGSKAPEELDPVPVRVHTVAAENLTDYLRFSGRVMGAGEIPIVSMANGLIKEVRITVGDWVKKDDVIVVLDDRLINEQIEKLEKTSKELRKRLDEIEKEVETLLEPPEEGLLPDNLFDRLTEVTRLMTEMQMISGQLMQVESAIAQAEAQRTNMTIKAPATGRAAMVMALPGGIAAAGNPLAVLVDTSRLYVDINVFENQIRMIEKEQEARVVVPAYSDYPLFGQVSVISPVLSPQTRAYTVRVLLNGMEKGSLSDQQGLFIGMFARVEIPARIYEQVLTLPREAVLDRYEGKFVFVVKGNRAELREVQTGFNTNEVVEILTGLSAGELVVTVGQYYLEDGDPVNVRGWGEER